MFFQKSFYDILLHIFFQLQILGNPISVTLIVHIILYSCYLLLAAGSSCLTYACCRMRSFELLMMDGKTVQNM